MGVPRFPRYQVGNFSVAENSQPPTSSQDVSSQTANQQNAKRDEVLNHMLKMKPQPKVSQQLTILPDGDDYSDTNISKGNKR
jgi:hypothetical protein